jgi:hypothetical protein
LALAKQIKNLIKIPEKIPDFVKKMLLGYFSEITDVRRPHIECMFKML